MTLLGTRICVALPDSLLEERSTPRDKTVKLGQIARSCSIFGVDRISIFQAGGQAGEAAFIRKVLEYLETPQYLRKHLFGFDESLRFAGLLPPLRIPSHRPRVPLERLRPGDFREGFLSPRGTVDIGLETELRLANPAPRGSGRVTVRITRTSPLEGTLADRTSPAEYWGYTVQQSTLKALLSDAAYPMRIATSRYGRTLSEAVGILTKRELPRGLMLLFGAPSRGLFDIVGKDLPTRVDLVVNLFEEQQVATVRTEESLLAALYLLEVLLALKKV